MSLSLAKSASTLDGHYDQLSSKWSVHDASSSYARLVVASDNLTDPVHRWFRFKEGYSNRLLAQILKDSAYEFSGTSFRVLDPFAGSGTTLLSAIAVSAEHSVSPRALGIERNPLLSMVSSGKAQAMIRGQELLPSLKTIWKTFKDSYMKQLRFEHSTESPTFNNPKYFSATSLRQLLAASAAARAIPDSLEKKLLFIAIASSIEPSGRLRRDGRALRFTPERVTREPWHVIEEVWSMIREDVGGLPGNQSGNAVVTSGDARRLHDVSLSRKFDWIVCSPPYPNNIDYTELYKLENWLLGGWKSALDMRRQRLDTLRSHPSVRFRRRNRFTQLPIAPDVEALLRPVLDAVPHDRYESGRIEMIEGYADDMLEVFSRARRAATIDGRMAFVVGNSVHGSGDDAFVIAADVLLARLAEWAGWTVEDVRVARRLKRRESSSEFLRESVVTLRTAE